MGTTTAPIERIAWSAMAHSIRFSERMATRSPCFTPRADRSAATARTRSTKESIETGSQRSPRFTRKASGFRWVSAAWRSRSGMVSTSMR